MISRIYGKHIKPNEKTIRWIFNGRWVGGCQWGLVLQVRMLVNASGMLRMQDQPIFLQWVHSTAVFVCASRVFLPSLLPCFLSLPRSLMYVMMWSCDASSLLPFLLLWLSFLSLLRVVVVWSSEWVRGDGSCRVVLSILLSRISRAIYRVEEEIVEWIPGWI